MKRSLSLLLALALLLGLTACGKQDGGQDTGPVYVISEAADCWAELSWLTGGCAAGDALYLTGVLQEKQPSGLVQQELGQVLRIPSGGGAAELLPAYRPICDEDAQRNFISSHVLKAGADGTLWESARVSNYFYDLPEGSDGESGEYRPSFNAERSWTSLTLRRLDQDGREQFRFERDAGLLEEQLGIGEVSGLLMDGDGDIVVLGGAGAAVLSQEGAVRFTLPEEEPEFVLYPPRLILLGDGRVGAADYASEGTRSYIRLRVIDKEARSWGKKCLLPAFGGVFDGAGDVLFYYLAGDELRAWREDTQDAGAGETVLSWADVGIDCDLLRIFAPLEDGRLAAVTADQAQISSDYSGGYEPDHLELSLLAQTGSPERKTLTYATLGLWGDRAAILEFNRTNPDYQIVVKDYTDYSPNASREDAIMRLATEIGAGKMPDLLVIEDMPVVQWASAGLLEDLWPWIDRDPELSREDLMERVFQAMEIDGKLYEVSDTFVMGTVFGRKDIVGDRMTWTPEDMEAALAELPEGSIGIDEGGADLLLNILRLDWGQFVDWEKGECSFDSEGFKDLLAFCGRFPESVPGDRWARVNAGQQLAATIFPGSFESVQDANAVVKGGAAFVGYPNPWGKVGSSFRVPRTISMCSGCKYKEGAWAFMRTLLLPQELEQSRYVGDNYFYTNKESFQRSAEKAMSPAASHNMNYGSIYVQRHGVTQEEYGQLMALYNAMDTVYRRDLSLEAIISEVAGAYFAGDKSLDEAASLIQNRASLYVNEQS